MKLSPIILFAYKRPNELKKVIDCLKLNDLSVHSELYIFIDGPNKEEDIVKVNEVRALCDEIIGFKEIHRHYHVENQGCANSIIDGISFVLKKHESAIIIEDDILTSTNFLSYMNQSLTIYQSQSKVFSISGFCLPFKRPSDYTADVFAFPRTCSWGWATWSDRWFTVDWSISDYQKFIVNSTSKKAFSFGGSDMVKMLKDFMQGKIDAWDIRFAYSQFKHGGVTIYPLVSKAQNIGFYGDDATHTNVFNRYQTTLDDSGKTFFYFITDLTLNSNLVSQFQARNSIIARGVGKIKTIIGMR
jgi:hypothetical protein